MKTRKNLTREGKLDVVGGTMCLLLIRRVTAFSFLVCVDNHSLTPCIPEIFLKIQHHQTW